MDQKRLVFIFPQQLIYEMAARRALLLKHVALIHAGLDQKPERERKIALPAEKANSLRPSIFFQHEVFLRKVVDDLSLLIANRGKYVYQVDVRRRCGCLLGNCRRHQHQEQRGQAAQQDGMFTTF